MVNNSPFPKPRRKCDFPEILQPCSLCCLQQLMILLQMSGLQQFSFVVASGRLIRNSEESGRALATKHDKVHYWRQLHASQGHSIDSSTDLNDPRIHLPFSFLLISPSNENIEKVIVTVNMQQNSFF